MKLEARFPKKEIFNFEIEARSFFEKYPPHFGLFGFLIRQNSPGCDRVSKIRLYKITP